MKKVFKFVKGKKDEKKESGGVTPSQSGDLVSPAQTPEDERFLGMDNSSGYVVDFCGKDKTLTKLHKAAWQGNLEKLKSALKKVEIDAVDKHNRTALHFAIAQGHPNIVWFLLGNNAKTSICDDEGHTPLLKAIECGYKECMTLLLDRGADVNVTDYTGNAGLHVAVNQASFDIASALLKKGADTEISNNAGDYPLHIATRLENKDLVDLLLNFGASVDVLDRENRTPLMLAAKTGNSLLVQLFVEHGAQLTVVDSNGWTAQDYAMLGGHENVAASLKSVLKNNEKKAEKSDESDLGWNESSESWGDSRVEESEKEPITQKFKKFFEKCSENDAEATEKEKTEELPESPDAEMIPPYCQPPKSWEMIQAGMIDEHKNGNEPKRRSITTLGTLHSRRKSFTEGSASSPQFTLSLNRRKGAKANNAFAKQRFSFNEEESLRYWINKEETIRKDLEKIELENMLNLEEVKEAGKRKPAYASDRNSMDNSKDSKEIDWSNSEETNSEDFYKSDSKDSEGGTLGRKETMNEVEEIWVTNSHLSHVMERGRLQHNSWDSEDASAEKEGSFPPPPTALELGVDMAKSIRYIKGISMDQPVGCATDRNLWKNFYESHSLDCLEERDFVETNKRNCVKTHGRHQSGSAQSGEDVLTCQKPRDRFVDVNRRINEQLECYDQALRELAESSKNYDKFSSQNYYSLPSTKTGSGCECKRANSQELVPNGSFRFLDSGPHSLPLYSAQGKVENNETLGLENPAERLSEETFTDKPDEKLGKKTKRHMLLAMRDVKHAVHAANTFRTSMDDQILSPLTKPEDSFDLDDKSSLKGISSSSGGNSPPDENPFFGMGRQETVLERAETRKKSSSSGTGEESTLWLQDDNQKKRTQDPDSEDDVSEIAADGKLKHNRVSSFSPLGIIQREMEEESRENKTYSYVAPESDRSTSERLPVADQQLDGENEEQNEEILREQNSDISLSSGPIEPIGMDKDSGSEPESSHNDASPTHNYALKSQHEWLKCHLKTATSEKIKLEELTAQLAEKAERLQYELADAKEAAKSRDEVIQLLQGQLTRMEAAYTKSLEESVQSRLQLTSHEQEINHLKEVCYRYEEEKEAGATGLSNDFLQELQLRIKMLEEEKEKMKEKIIHLEEEKLLLEKRLKQDKKEESEVIDQCQRWKERCRKLEEMARAYDSKQAAYESYMKKKNRELLEQENQFKQQSFQSEKKYLELNEENIELKAKVQSLSIELEVERRKDNAKNDKTETVSELKKTNVEMEIRLKNLEKDMEENLVKKLKQKEEEVENLVKQFNRERDSLIASYEKKLMEGKSDQSLLDAFEWKKENQRLRQMIQSLQDQLVHMQTSASMEMVLSTPKNEFYREKGEWDSGSKSVVEMSKNLRQLNTLAAEKLNVRRDIKDFEKVTEKEGGKGEAIPRGFTGENAQIKTDNLDLISQANSFPLLLYGERWSSTDGGNHKKFNQKLERKRRGVGKEDELAWSSLYGMKETKRRKGGRSASVTETLIKDCDAEGSSDEEVEDSKKLKSTGKNIMNRLSAAAEEGKEEEVEISQKLQKLEFLELKKEILSLQSKMSDEKNLRHALENQMLKMNLDLCEKENLEKEINSLKKKVDRDCLRRSEMELFEYQKVLEEKREKYLEGPERRGADDDYKAKCEILASEREKSKKIKNFFCRRANSFEFPLPQASSQLKFYSCPCPHPEVLLEPHFLALDPEIKTKLEEKLDRSIRKYAQESSSTSSIRTELLQKKYF